MPDRAPRPLPDDIHGALKERLRREACLTRPAFSERLHQRLRQAVRQCSAAADPRSRLRDRENPSLLWLVAGAIAGVFIVSLIFWPPGKFDERDGSARSAQRHSPIAASLPRPPQEADGLATIAAWTDLDAERFDVLVDSTLATRRWAYLDQDAQTALAMLADHVPVDVGFLLGLDTSEDPAAGLTQQD
ncbi:MAG: hypothetical protein HUU20_26375 [Pirellulales bacterium]|nr:hypothetical protein [Pirellulales bacterium]